MPSATLLRDRVRPFVACHRERLCRLFADYAEDDRAEPLLFDAVSLLVFESLERDRFALRVAWPPRATREALDRLTCTWGAPVP